MGKLIQLWKEHFIACFFTTVFVAGATWGAFEVVRVNSLKQTIENFEVVRVNPLKQSIEGWKEVATRYEQRIRETDAAFESYRKGYDQILANYNTLEINYQVQKIIIKQREDIIKQYENDTGAWKKQYSELQIKVVMYESNCNIMREIRTLEQHKAEVDNLLIVSSQRSSPWRQIDSEPIWKRQSDGYQNQILEYQKKLVCIPQ